LATFRDLCIPLLRFQYCFYISKVEWAEKIISVWRGEYKSSKRWIIE
jgi:hypothetical protein